MTAFDIFLIVLLVLALLSFLRVGAEVTYDEDGFTALVKAGPFKFRIYPMKKKAPKKAKRRRAEKEEKEKKGGTFERLRQWLPVISDAGAMFKRRLRIDLLEIYFTAASDDPARAALMFGYASAGIGILLPVLENNFDIKDRDLRTDVSFELKKPEVILRAVLTLAIWQILYITAVMSFKVLRTYLANKKEKAV